jgi:hypothetical protein
MSDLEIRRIDPPIPDKFSLESILRCNSDPAGAGEEFGSFLNRSCETTQRRFASLNMTGPQATSWLLFGFFGNFENNLAARVTSRDLFLSFNCLRKWERLRHYHFDFLLVD